MYSLQNCSRLAKIQTEHCLSPRRPIVVYTDGCTNQNRNDCMSNVLLHFAIQNDIISTQKYLVKGHTLHRWREIQCMRGSRSKSKEREFNFHLKLSNIARIPSKLPSITKLYSWNMIFFKDFTNISYYNSVRPGRKKGDACVVDVSNTSPQEQLSTNYPLMKVLMICQEDQTRLKKNWCHHSYLKKRFPFHSQNGNICKI